jgi:hypothetical protein
MGCGSLQQLALCRQNNTTGRSEPCQCTGKILLVVRLTHLLRNFLFQVIMQQLFMSAVLVSLTCMVNVVSGSSSYPAAFVVSVWVPVVQNAQHSSPPIAKF